MGTLGKILAYTNPVTILVGVHVLVGIIIAAMLDNIVRKTSKIVKAIDKELM